MYHLNSYKIFESRLRSERLEIYRDSNIVIVAPTTHRAHQKYAIGCKWCINSDFYEWDEYHRGNYVLIIQRRYISPRVGISGEPTYREIFANDQGYFYDLYDFGDDIKRGEYFDKITSDINSFDLNTVYYADGIMYDKENNNILEYNRGSGSLSKFSINDIPNITIRAISKVRNYLM